MNLPKIDVSALPDLQVLTGMFGSLGSLGRADVLSDDTLIILMVFIYELFPDPSLGL